MEIYFNKLIFSSGCGVISRSKKVNKINDKKKIKILLRLKTRIARHLVDSYFTPFQKGYTAVRRMKERAEFSLNKLTELIFS